MCEQCELVDETLCRYAATCIKSELHDYVMPARAALAALTAERDVLKESLAQYDRGWKAADAERDRYKAALEQIAAMHPIEPYWWHKVATDALSHEMQTDEVPS